MFCTSKPEESLKGKTATIVGATRDSGNIVAINNLRSRLGQMLPFLIRLHPALVIFLGLVVYASIVILFGILLWLTGEACFYSAVGFDIADMLWLSVHTFSSVGFGSTYPICHGAQLIVHVETYFAVLVQSIVGAYVVFIIMRSRARIRFSRHCLITYVEQADASKFGRFQQDRYREVSFRLVRESDTQVRDAKIYAQARFSQPGAESTTLRGELELASTQMSSLDYWHITHRITPTSPLWHIRKDLRAHLKSVDVSLSAYDPSFQSDIKLYVNYQKDDFVHNARFAPMSSSSADGTKTVVDHAKLDEIERDTTRRPSLTSSLLGGMHRFRSR